MLFRKKYVKTGGELEMNVIEALNWRYAVREFSNEKISDESLKTLLDATRLAATSYGLQPYRLMVIDDKELRKKLLEFSFGQKKVLYCSHLVVFAAQTNIGDSLVDNYIRKVSNVRKIPITELRDYADHIKAALSNKSDKQKREWAHQQAYIALGTLLTSAALLGIDTCPMGGIDARAYDDTLNFKSINLETSMVCALGVRAQQDKSAGLKKVRYDESEMLVTI
tara:strand:+ start:2899 stop:3570 length:672 start_codon:yes stop_codon:yes gene_type:complete